MPIITAINVQEKCKKRCNVFVDGEFFSAISIETAVLNRLKAGMEISVEALNKIINESNKKEAIEKAVSFVSKALKTKKQVYTYIIGKGYSEEIAWACIDKLKEYNLINDRDYSRRYIESSSKNQGQRLIEYKLMMKGVKKDDIQSAYSECDIKAEENAKAVAIKYMKNKEATKENVAKAYRYLIGRGFTYEQACYAVESLKKEEE